MCDARHFFTHTQQHHHHEMLLYSHWWAISVPSFIIIILSFSDSNREFFNFISGTTPRIRFLCVGRCVREGNDIFYLSLPANSLFGCCQYYYPSLDLELGPVNTLSEWVQSRTLVVERETESDSGHRKALSGHPVERHGAPRTGLNSRGAGIHHNTAIWPGIKRWVAELLAEYTRARTIKTIETGEISSRIERDHVGHEVFCFCKWNIFYDSLNKVISRIVLLGDSKESWEGYLSFYVHCRKTGKLKVVTEEVGNVWNSILFKI